MMVADDAGYLTVRNKDTMFFIISKLLMLFTVPLTYILLCMLAALLFYRTPKIGRTCLILALVLLFVFGTPFVPDWLVDQLETAYNAPDAPPHVDAIIVLSGMLDVRASSPEYLEFGKGVERILTGMQLLQQGVGDVLLITGGNGDLYDQTKREAVLLRQFAIDFGIPHEKILIEPDSRNTYENAVNTGELMQQHGLSSAILVTTASHMPRSVKCFQKIGLQPIPYPVDFMRSPTATFRLSDIVPNLGNLNHTTRVVHEYIGLLTYKIAGYI